MQIIPLNSSCGWACEPPRALSLWSATQHSLRCPESSTSCKYFLLSSFQLNHYFFSPLLLILLSLFFWLYFYLLLPLKIQTKHYPSTRLYSTSLSGAAELQAHKLFWCWERRGNLPFLHMITNLFTPSLHCFPFLSHGAAFCFYCVLWESQDSLLFHAYTVLRVKRNQAGPANICHNTDVLTSNFPSFLYK